MGTVTWDEDWAQFYDATYAAMAEPEVVDPMVDVLADIAHRGRALEFAIGTGRIALPLCARGVAVAGIELSPAMVAQFRRKAGAEKIDVAVGDMATTRLGESFNLVYLVANSIMNVTTQDEQCAVFENAAAHLEPGGAFVVELIVPQLQRVPPRRDKPRLHARPRPRGHRVLRGPRRADRLVTPLDPRRRPAGPPLGPLSLRLAVRARPDGTPRRPEAA